MKRLLEYILFVCFHEYDIIDKRDILPFNPYAILSKDVYEIMKESAKKYEKPIGTQYVLKCKKCGKMKTYKVMYD